MSRNISSRSHSSSRLSSPQWPPISRKRQIQSNFDDPSILRRRTISTHPRTSPHRLFHSTLAIPLRPRTLLHNLSTPTFPSTAKSPSRPRRNPIRRAALLTAIIMPPTPHRLPWHNRIWVSRSRIVRAKTFLRLINGAPAFFFLRLSSSS